jgi:hypothetical protein
MESKQSSIYLLAAVAALLLGLYLLMEIPSLIEWKNNSSDYNTSYFTNTEIRKIDNALKRKVNQNHFVYTSTFENPFRKRGDDPANSNNQKRQFPERPKLFLKGILQKNVPLAIIEDQNGETYIRGIGDNVLDQQLIKIVTNKVTLRDNRGTYDLVVEEQ